jgi:hypothetical protein
MRERLARAIFFRGDKQDDVQWDYVRRDLAEKAMAQADAVLAEIEAAGMVLVPRDELPDKGVTMAEWMRTCVRLSAAGGGAALDLE